MVRTILIGATLLVTTALVAYAHDIRTETEQRTEYRAQIADTGRHQGREYMQNGVLVIEGAPRWTEYRQTSATRRLPHALESLVQIFD
jgi:hypothetical protein